MMRKRMFLFAMLYSLLAQSFFSAAQREQKWTFGNGGGLDFSSGNPVPFKSGIYANEGCATVCDTMGNLLFYSEGSVVWDRNHNIMQGGTALTPIPNTFMTPTYSTSQGVVIVPMPDDADKYYVFSLVASEWPNDFGKLYYSVVDMSLNGGSGAVVPGSKAIFVDEGMLERMTAVVGDDCNIWLLTAAKTGNIRAYEITVAGVNRQPVVSSVGIGSAGRPYGCMKVSPDRKKLAVAQMGTGDGTVLYDFDASSGKASNQLILTPSGGGTYDICFSPDNSKLYTISSLGTNQVTQFDLAYGNRDSIIQSATYIAGIGFAQIKAAENGRIYFKTASSTMAEIKYPNLKGTACEMAPFGVSFPFNPDLSSRPGLPNAVPDLRRKDLYTATSETVRFKLSLYLRAQDTTGIRYTWNDGATGASRTVRSSGTYWVSYHMPPCSERVDTFYIDFTCPLPAIAVRPSCDSTASGRVSLEGGDSDYLYEWRYKDSILATGPDLDNAYPGLYSVKIHSGSGCDTLLSVQVPAVMDKVFFTTDTLTCQDNEIVFQNRSGAGYQEFYWSFGDGNFNRQKEPKHSYRAPGLYQVKLIGQGLYCFDSLTRQIVVDAPVPGYSVLQDKDSICQGDVVSFRPATDKTLTEIAWEIGPDKHFLSRPGDGTISSAFDGTGSVPVIVEARFRVCPPLRLNKTVWVQPLPPVDLGPDLELCLQDQPHRIYNRAVLNGNKYRYQWNTGPNSPEIDIRSYGTHELILEDEMGCRGSGRIDIRKACAIDIPNSFSPNRDGHNDYFFPRFRGGSRLLRFELRIYNRSGSLLFATNEISDRGWDGQWNAIPQPQGVYIYQFVVEWDKGQREQYTGNLTLIR